MTPEQELNEVRKELAVNERLAQLILSVAKHQANAEFRHMYKSNEAAIMIRQTGIAEGIEKLAAAITASPVAARPSDDRKQRSA